MLCSYSFRIQRFGISSLPSVPVIKLVAGCRHYVSHACFHVLWRFPFSSTSASTRVTSFKSNIVRSLLSLISAPNSSRSSDRIRPINQMIVVLPSHFRSIFNGACASYGRIASMFRRLRLCIPDAIPNMLETNDLIRHFMLCSQQNAELSARDREQFRSGQIPRGAMTS
jgi:hypothetical protein